MEWICTEEKHSAGQWRVEARDKGYVTIFSGPDAQQRALEYTAFQNAQTRWQERESLFRRRAIGSE